MEANVRGSRDPDLKLEVGPFPARPFLTRTFSNSEEVEPAFGRSTGPRQVPSYWYVEISSLSEKAGGKRAHHKEDAHSNEGRAALVRGAGGVRAGGDGASMDGPRGAGRRRERGRSSGDRRLYHSLAVKRGRIGRLNIEELEAGRLHVRELVVEQERRPVV